VYLLGKQNTWHFNRNTYYLNYIGQPFNAFEGTNGCLAQELLELQKYNFWENAEGAGVKVGYLYKR
jgi:hypothetical protein